MGIARVGGWRSTGDGTFYQDQVFLLRRGLLQHITASLIQTDSRQGKGTASREIVLLMPVEFCLLFDERGIRVRIGIRQT
jgi:hypothetical protein